MQPLARNIVVACLLAFVEIFSASKSRADSFVSVVKRVYSEATAGQKLTLAAKAGDAGVSVLGGASVTNSARELAGRRFSGETTFENGAALKAGKDIISSGCGFAAIYCTVRDSVARVAGPLGELSNQQQLSINAFTANVSNYDRVQALTTQLKITESVRQDINKQAEETLPDRSFDAIAESVPGGSVVKSVFDYFRSDEADSASVNASESSVSKSTPETWSMASIAPVDGEVKVQEPAQSRNIEQPKEESKPNVNEENLPNESEQPPVCGTMEWYDAVGGTCRSDDVKQDEDPEDKQPLKWKSTDSYQILRSGEKLYDESLSQCDNIVTAENSNDYMRQINSLLEPDEGCSDFKILENDISRMTYSEQCTIEGWGAGEVLYQIKVIDQKKIEFTTIYKLQSGDLTMHSYREYCG